MLILEFTQDPPVTPDQLDKLEYYLDILYGKNNIDFEFTRHFIDRVNDSRNVKQITAKELAALFVDIHKRYGKRLENSSDDYQAVMKDMQTDINCPFVIDINRNGDMQLIVKTVMRKKDFRTSNPILAVHESSDPEYHEYESYYEWKSAVRSRFPNIVIDDTNRRNDPHASIHVSSPLSGMDVGYWDGDMGVGFIKTKKAIATSSMQRMKDSLKDWD